MLNDTFGIVTSCYNGYDRFLKRWAISIINMKLKPNMVSVIQSGLKYNKANFKEIEKIFNKNKIIFNLKFLSKHKGMGYARNKAVEITKVDRIMYLDIDDIVCKNTLVHSKKYLNHDVICGGLQIIETNGSIKNKLFKSSRMKVLRGKWCCCSHAIYKRKFWKISPYIEINDFIDFPLWLGFAQHGATFIGTNEIFTSYLRRNDGHHLKMTNEDIIKMKEQKRKFLRNGVNSKCLKI